MIDYSNKPLNFTFTARLNKDELLILLANVLSDQFKASINPQDIEFDFGTVAKGYGMGEYQETDLNGIVVNVRPRPVTSVIYQDNNIAELAPLQHYHEYNDCIQSPINANNEAYCNDTAVYGLVETSVTNTASEKTTDASAAECTFMCADTNEF